MVHPNRRPFLAEEHQMMYGVIAIILILLAAFGLLVNWVTNLPGPPRPGPTESELARRAQIERIELLYTLKQELHNAPTGSAEEARVLKMLDNLDLSYSEWNGIASVGVLSRERDHELRDLLRTRLIDAMETDVQAHLRPSA